MEANSTGTRRVELMLGVSCLILAVACLLLAWTIAFGPRHLFSKTDAEPVHPDIYSSAALAANDSRIRETLTQAYQVAPCCDSLRNGQVAVAVNRGEVTLSGEVPSSGDRNSALFYARLVPGVTQVHDSMVVRAHAEEKPTVAKSQQLEKTPGTTVALVHPAPASHTNNSEDTREAQTWVDLGNKDLNDADNPNYDSAIRYFKLALAVDPHNTAARNGLQHAQRAKKAEEALRVLP